MTQPKPEDIARQIVEACAFSRKVKPITWTDDLYDNVLLAILEAEARGERRGLERGAAKLAAIAGGTRSTRKSLDLYNYAATIRALIPAGPGSTA